MFGIGKGFAWVCQPFYDDGDGGGGGGTGDVTNLPPVPAPSDDDIDALGGDEDDDGGDDEIIDEGGDKDDDTGDDDKPPKPRERKPKSEDKPDDKDDKDDDLVDEGDEDEDDKSGDDDKTGDKDDKDDDKDVPKDDLASIKAIKADYPDIFKKHPQLRVAIAEHRQFRQMFTNIDEAKEATEAAQDLFDLRDNVLEKADAGYLIDQLSQADGPAAARFVRKFLPALMERSKDLYYEVTQVPISQFVHAAYARAVRENNNNLKNSALHLWKFFGKDGIPAATAAGPSEADQAIETRMQEFEQRQTRQAEGVVNREIQTGLVGLIEHAIDPENSLKETTKRALVAELVRTIDGEVAADQNHMARVRRLWANARRSSYAQGHTSRITTAYLERAKQLLPKHARRVREELGITAGNGQADKGKPKDERRPAPTTQRQSGPATRPSPSGNRPTPRTIRDTNPRSIDWNRTSDEDILSGKARLRPGR